MQKNLIKAGILAGMVLLFTACKDDGNDLGDGNGDTGIITNVNDIEYDFNVPSTYVFERNNETTVSFSGQTARLAMNKEILSYFSVTSGKTTAEIEAAFDHTAGNNDFIDAGSLGLNASSKSVKSKIAASDDLFGSDFLAEEAIQAVFSSYIASQVAEVVPNKDNTATAGNAGMIADGSSTRYVNGKGLEYNQAFAKGTIGALIVDQVLNNYLGTNRIYNEDYIAKNNAGDLAVSNDKVDPIEYHNYTTYEHHFDEAFGYVYGDPSVNFESPISYESDAFLFKYITRVESDIDFSGIQEQIFKAFKIGRAAIVAQDYDVLKDAVSVLQYQISKVIGVRAVYYLQAGKNALAAQDFGGAFHDLSEGYGFVYSLQFTRNPYTGNPYATSTEVENWISQLEAGKGNGFWDLTDGVVLDKISNEIASKFDFSTAEAAE